MKFLQRYREENAYYEYGIAAFEPGLSLPQRRLLFAGAVARLRLPLAGTEKQPVAAPRTIIPPATGFGLPVSELELEENRQGNARYHMDWIANETRLVASSVGTVHGTRETAQR
jgi:hypothetical protein